MDRRNFLKRTSAVFLAGTVLDVTALAAPVPTVFYVDGYHGGSRGHMPAGCWRDILEALQTWPEWKLSLDVEPNSWEVLKREDPEAYRELQGYLADSRANARVTIVGGTFAQPYGWAISGESNIRQLKYGLHRIHEHFPSAVVDVYAVQEPCWSSCLPQILRSLGFKGASLKNASTAWGGYTAGFDAELVNWIGPDQTSILAVPRYACEQLVNTWETEAEDASPSYLIKCVDHGIPQPVGMCFQDLGWAARPRIAGPHVRYVTWQEYLFDIARVPAKDWHFTMEDIRTTLPWGEKTLQKVAQQSRSAETRLLTAEKIAAMACVQCGAEWPANSLNSAWEQVMWSQFHDSWITATTKSGRQAWAFQVAAQTLEAQNTAEDILQQSASTLSQGQDDVPRHPIGTQRLRVFNTLGHDREDLVECTIAFDRHTEDLRVLDEHGAELPIQWSAIRRYHPGESGPPSPEPAQGPASPEINTGRLLFKARVPAVGFNSYQVVPLPARSAGIAHSVVKALMNEDGTILLENEFYSIRLDPKRGGAITSLLEKEGSRELCPDSGEFLFNEYRGYFIAQKRWRSSTETPATVEILESGPIRAVVCVNGEVGGCPSRTLITLVTGEHRIDFDATFHFAQETWIGDPWDIQPKDRMTEQHRSSNDGRWKLQALFPTSFAQTTLDKNGAFDVCRSRNANTYFQRWDEIKHNIIVNWVDVLNESKDAGLALFSEHTTAYTHGPDHPLSIVLGWGWEGGFWWGKCPLLGEQRAQYSLIPHRENWQQAKLWQEQSKLEEPLLPALIDGRSLVGPARHSLLSVSDEGVQLSSMMHVDNALEVRLFNAKTIESHCTITCSFKPTRAQLVELNGKVNSELTLHTKSSGDTSVNLVMQPFGIRTLRFSTS
ncbi:MULTISPECIES: glycoside hydrolase family 38 C-terminal domain-containing protein [Acidobacteriaceae]|uniref:glycoside hydrolase family 38 N-terminal domain-containing protein n=1 Tax=Acidobacteriaceae TaxID=204434 RepID=UPI00131D2C9A|nr:MULTISPECIES: glycoside hydrolase family 38 C-terminal domain-containing protein [Acidobacteriaceae]MDW5265398.1 glycoside hydrolase family 38 C-terminal domain-containing protein [Edaphobacter sp.]